MSLPKTIKNADFRETSQILYLYKFPMCTFITSNVIGKKPLAWWKTPPPVLIGLMTLSDGHEQKQCQNINWIQKWIV